MMARLKELETENARLKKMYAEERLKAEILKEAIEKSGKAVAPTEVCAKGGANPFHYHQVCMWSICAERNLLPLSGKTQ